MAAVSGPSQTFGISPILSLAFGLHGSRGSHAVLVGSGVSKAAGILTGWEITEDLIRKLAAADGADAGPRPAAWFHAQYGIEPDYSDLLSRLAPEPAERRDLLRSYFEPTPEEHREGRKVPTAAHRALAELAATGHIRLVVTTNFDRLMETALESARVPVVTASTDDQVRNLFPIPVNACVIVKLHGDYLDARIRNTVPELSQYPTETNRILDRIFDEYGLIIAGWSAEWDVALRAAMERATTRRYSIYWGHRGELQPQAVRLVALRGAVTIPIESADQFFTDLHGKVSAIEQFRPAHPLSVQMALAELKRYLPDPAQSIRLHDLIADVGNTLVGDVENHLAAIASVKPSDENIEPNLRRYHSMSETAATLIAHGVYFGEARHHDLWVSLLERVAHPSTPNSSFDIWSRPARYPALLMSFAAGLSALAANKIDALAVLQTRPSIKTRLGDEPLATSINVADVLSDFPKRIPKYANMIVAHSEYVHDNLRPILRGLIPREEVFERLYDRFEYYTALIHADEAERRHEGISFHYGRYVYKWREQPGVRKEFAEELDRLAQDHPLLRAGLFQGSLDRLRAIRTAVEQALTTRGAAY